MTPDTGETDRIPRPSRRAIALGAVGVLLAGALVAALGFFTAHTSSSQLAPDVVAISTQSGQLNTFALHDEKPMRAIGKGIAAP